MASGGNLEMTRVRSSESLRTLSHLIENIPDCPNTAGFEESVTRTTTVSDLGFFAFTWSEPGAASRLPSNNSHVVPPSREMLTSTLLTPVLADHVMLYL